MIKLRLLITFLLLTCSVGVLGFENLVLGSRNPNFQGMSDAEFVAFTLNTRKAAKYGLQGSRVTNFIETDNSFFALLKGMELVGVNIQSEILLGIWPLNYSPYQYTPKIANEQYRAIDTFIVKSFELESGGIGLGCMGNTPLRYGDIESDGESEIILTLGRVFVVFSLEYERVVFSDFYRIVDELDASIYQTLYGDQAFPEAQFVSDLAAINGYPRMPALRYYTKIYSGDFDDDGHPDIITWHKGYLSRRSDDATAGYELKEEAWTHYERDLEAQVNSSNGITGHYIPQQTDEADIQNWLAENNLTWSKGYPSKSECPGEEGQLIQEMHDPLLNDPDVLK